MLSRTDGNGVTFGKVGLAEPFLLCQTDFYA